MPTAAVPEVRRHRTSDIASRRTPSAALALPRAVLRICTGTGGLAAQETFHLRLFRNDPRIRFHYRVHEQVAPSVRHGVGELRTTDIVIRHEGYADATVVTARALAPPLAGGFVGGLRPRDLPGGRHPSYAASIYCRFRTFTLRIHGYLQASHNRRERELRRLVLGRRNWLFTWLDEGAERTASILTILATCIAHDVSPRAYLHLVTTLLVRGWPKSKLRDLLPDRVLDQHPELFVGDVSALPSVPEVARLST